MTRRGLGEIFLGETKGLRRGFWVLELDNPLVCVCVCVCFFSSPRWLKAIGVLTSNKEGKVICEIDGLVLGGVQFGVPV